MSDPTMSDRTELATSVTKVPPDLGRARAGPAAQRRLGGARRRCTRRGRARQRYGCGADPPRAGEVLQACRCQPAGADPPGRARCCGPVGASPRVRPVLGGPLLRGPSVPAPWGGPAWAGPVLRACRCQPAGVARAERTGRCRAWTACDPRAGRTSRARSDVIRSEAGRAGAVSRRAPDELATGAHPSPGTRRPGEPLLVLCAPQPGAPSLRPGTSGGRVAGRLTGVVRQCDDSFTTGCESPCVSALYRIGCAA